MRRKYRLCDEQGCHQPVFSHNKCKYHQSKLSKSPIIPKDISFQKGLSQDITIVSQFKNEIDMFHWIWKNRKHESFLTGRKLSYDEGDALWHNQFAHVLPKGINMFPLFKLNPDDVILLTPYEHHLLDHGTNVQRMNYSINWSKIYKLANELWDKYYEINKNCVPLLTKYRIND